VFRARAFYINRLGFHAVEFFNEHHPDPHMPEQFDQEDGLFKFEKCVYVSVE
jgi:hypothetical protein